MFRMVFQDGGFVLFVDVQLEEAVVSHARHLQEMTAQKDTRIAELSKVTCSPLLSLSLSLFLFLLPLSPLFLFLLPLSPLFLSLSYRVVSSVVQVSVQSRCSELF